MPVPTKQQEMLNKLNYIIRKVEMLQESIEEQKRPVVMTAPTMEPPKEAIVKHIDLAPESMGRRRTIY